MDVRIGRLVRKDVFLTRTERGPSSSSHSSEVREAVSASVTAAISGSATAAFPADVQLRRDKFTVGRSNAVDCPILSHNISKMHAVFRRRTTDGVATTTWTITDCKSTNGVYVNGVRLVPDMALALSPLDEVCFQCKTDEPRTTYVFLLESTAPSVTASMSPSTSLRPQQQQLDVGDGRDRPKRIKLQRDEPNDRYDGVESEPSARILQVQNELLQDKLLQQKREYEENLRDQTDGAAAREAEMKLQNQMLQEQIDQAEYRIQEVQRIADEEMSRVEKEISEKDEVISKLEEVMLISSIECRELGDKLQTMEAAAAAVHSPSSSQKNNFATVLKNMLENECQCSICSELLYKTTTLQCSHSYCGHCISEWQKKKADCPICRQPIIAFVHTLVVDAFIDRAMELLPADVKARREETIAERNLLTAQSNIAAVANQQSARVRSTRRRRAAMESPPPPPSPVPDNVIDLSSSESDTSLDDDGTTEEYDDSDMESGSRAYYGGYGHCFVCGDTGHWANGCPYR